MYTLSLHDALPIYEKAGNDIPDRARKIDVPIDEGEETVDGVRLVYRHLRHSETEDALTIGLPDATAIIVQDLVYNRAHVFLGERRFESWRAALTEYRTLPFTTVLPGHGVPGGPELYDRMGDYLDYAETALEASTDKTDFKRRLLECSQIRRAKDRRPSNALSVSRLSRLAKREECMMISVLKASGLAMATVMLLGAITLAAESTSTYVEPMDA